MEYKAKVSEAKNWAATASVGKAGQSKVFEPSEEQMLRSQSLTNRRIFQSKVSEAVVHEAEQHTAIVYEGYDAATGMAKLTDAKGNISYAAPITNGAVSKGEIIRARHGSLMTYDAMPHLPQTVARKKSKPKQPEDLEVALLYLILSTHYRHIWAARSVYGNDTYLGIGPTESKTTRANSIGETQFTYSCSHEVKFGHGGHPGGAYFTGIDPDSTYWGRSITFICPTESTVSISLTLNPGGGITSTYCGIGVNKYVQRDESNPFQAYIMEESCSAYSEGTSTSYSTQLQAGYHFVSCQAIYNWEYPTKAESAADILYRETVAVTVNITVTTTLTKSLLYLQQGSIAIKLGEIDQSVLRYYEPYLSSLGNGEFYAHFRVEDSNHINQEMHRYIVSGSDVTEQVFFKTEETGQTIPPLEDDWQSGWVNWYSSDPTIGNPCADPIDPLTRKYINLQNDKILRGSFFESVEGKPLLQKITKQDVKMPIEIKTVSIEEGTCDTKSSTTKTAKLKKLFIPEGIKVSQEVPTSSEFIMESFVSAVAVSPILKR